MSDNRKWWKTWNTVLHDAKFQNIRLEDIGFWTLLMCLVNEQGERGNLTILPPASITVSLLRCSDVEDLKMRAIRLPNVTITPPKSDNGEFTLTVSKWFTYQVDPTASDRVKRSRYKRREEKRREEQRPFLSKTETPSWM
jgi:hypothetical protein